MVILVQNTEINQFNNALLSQIRIYRLCTKTQQSSALMDRTRFPAFHNQGKTGTFLCPHHMLLHCRNCQKTRNRKMVFINTAVTQNKNIRTRSICSVTAETKLFHCLFQRSIRIIQHTDYRALQMRLIQRFDLHHIGSGQNRILDFKNRTVGTFLFEKISLRTEVYRRIGNDLFPD